MRQPNFELDGMRVWEYKLSAGEKPSPKTWASLLATREAAFRAEWGKDGAGKRSEAEMTAFLGSDNPPEVIKSFIDPQRKVRSGRYSGGQILRGSRLFIVDHEDRPKEVLSYLHVADNTSGRFRHVKQFFTPYDYFKLEEAATHPDHQGRGMMIAQLGIVSQLVDPRRPGSAYTYPGENPKVTSLLEGVGYYRTGHRDVAVFGRGNESTEMIRLQADQMHSVGEKLIAMTTGQLDIVELANQVEHGSGIVYLGATDRSDFGD